MPLLPLPGALQRSDIGALPAPGEQPPHSFVGRRRRDPVAKAPAGIAAKWVQLQVPGKVQHHLHMPAKGRRHYQVSDIEDSLKTVFKYWCFRTALLLHPFPLYFFAFLELLQGTEIHLQGLSSLNNEFSNS